MQAKYARTCMLDFQPVKKEQVERFLYLSYVLLSVEPEALQTSIVENL